MIVNETDAIFSLVSNADFTFRYGALNWLDSRVCPTSAEITAEVARLQTEYNNNQFQRDRALEYPSLEEQADMAYWDRQNGTTTLDDAISKVKLKFKKP